jgi:peptidyl-prolyl cis-trans isomerase D
MSRSFVKNIYAAKLGQVLEPERVGENYVVAIVTGIDKEGTQTASKARMTVEPLLMNRKKAEIIQKKIGKVTTLEAASAALGGKAIETADSVRLSGTQTSIVASEPKIIGATFNPANNGKVVGEAIAGTSGVYVVRVDNISATAVANANVAEQRKAKYQDAKTRGAYPQMALSEAATIKDNRSKIY